MHGEAPPGSLVAAAYDEVVAAVRTVVDDVDPAVVVTLDPDHGDGHRDHERIGRATVEACAGRPGTRVYLWVVARELMRAWFTELARVRPDAGHLALDLDAAGIGRPDTDVTTLLDVSANRVLREQAMAEHRSQQPPWRGGDLERSLI